MSPLSDRSPPPPWILLASFEGTVWSTVLQDGDDDQDENRLEQQHERFRLLVALRSAITAGLRKIWAGQLLFGQKIQSGPVSRTGAGCERSHSFQDQTMN